MNNWTDGRFVGFYSSSIIVRSSEAIKIEGKKSYNMDLLKRTKKFAHDCVKLALKLPNTYLGNHIKGQLIRCSTSVAAN